MINCGRRIHFLSRPAVVPAEFLALFEDAKEKQEKVVVITISSKLSGTYNGAMLAKDMAEYDNIYVVDSLQASLLRKTALWNMR